MDHHLNNNRHVKSSSNRIPVQEDVQKSTRLICALLQLNLKLFQDLFRYKHAFNSFQADMNTHLTTIANQQFINQQNLSQNGQIRNAKSLQHTKQKVADMICKKFIETCSHLTIQPALATGRSDDYESNVYSILAIVDNFNNYYHQPDSIDGVGDSDSEHDERNDSELKSLSRQIGSFLKRLNHQNNLNSSINNHWSTTPFRTKLLEQLYRKLCLSNESNNKIDSDDKKQQRKIYENIPNYSQCFTQPQQQQSANQFKNNTISNLQDSGIGDDLNHIPNDNEETKVPSEINQNRKSFSSNNTTVPNVYKCKYCTETFYQVGQLIGHQRDKHRSRFGCGRCRKNFRNEYVLRVHLRNESCFNDSELIKHLLDDSHNHKLPQQSQKQHQDDNISDDNNKIINNTSKNDPPSPIELNQSGPERKHKCKWPGCGKTFTRTSYLTNHMMAHSNARNFICHWPDCPKRYKTKAHLMNHLAIHFKCENNGQDVHITEEMLLMHHPELLQQPKPQSTPEEDNISEEPEEEDEEDEEQVNSTTEAPPTQQESEVYTCPWMTCCQTFESELDLLEHYQRSHGSHEAFRRSSTKPSSSSVIGDSNKNLTTRQQQLMLAVKAQEMQQQEQQQSSSIAPQPEHQQNHSKQFQCEYCGTSFTKRSSLSNHVKSHSGQYSCSWDGCMFRTTAAYRLSKHLMSHLMSAGGNKQQSVDQFQSVLQSSELSESFTCKLCGKSFAKRASILNHVRSHSGQYSCEYPGCYFATQSKVLYRKHIQKAKHTTATISSSDQQPPLPQLVESNQNNHSSSILASALEGKMSIQPQVSTLKRINMDDNQRLILTKKIKSEPVEEEEEEEEEEMLVNDQNSLIDQEKPQQQQTQPHSITSIRIFQCSHPGCSYRTQKRPLYRVHMLKHSEVRKHHCQWCGKRFKSKSSLNRHLVRHHGRRGQAQPLQLQQHNMKPNMPSTSTGDDNNNNNEVVDEEDMIMDEQDFEDEDEEDSLMENCLMANENDDEESDHQTESTITFIKDEHRKQQQKPQLKYLIVNNNHDQDSPPTMDNDNDDNENDDEEEDNQQEWNEQNLYPNNNTGDEESSSNNSTNTIGFLHTTNLNSILQENIVSK